MQTIKRSTLSLGLALSLSTLGTVGTASAQEHPDARAVQVARELSTAFEAAAESVQQAVVSIRSVHKIEPKPDAQVQGQPFFDLHQFFGDSIPLPFRRPDQTRPRIQEGQGSGFVVSSDGYIVTNNHVVEGADEVEVRFIDDRNFTAKIVGTDPQTDIAILKVDADDLEAVHLGDSDQLGVGEWVIAAGNPFGLTSTITAGVVSAVGRSHVGLADYEDFIQTDAAINPGNSGGPLVNLDGEVVGVNSAIYTRSGGYMGIGFAIPINMVKSIKDSLIRDGSVSRGYLGIMIQDLNEGLARSFGFEGTDGVLISDVVSGGPADHAKLEPSDIIVKFDGEKATDMNQFRLRVSETKPGSVVPIDIIRNKEPLRIEVKIGELPHDRATASGRKDDLGHDLGLELRTLTPDLASQAGLDQNLHGVIVMRVEPLGNGARAGLRPGDVITRIQGTPIASVSDMQSALDSSNLKDGVRMTVRSKEGRHYVYFQQR